MNYTEILYDVKNGVAHITLNRPDRLNAWTRVMEEEFGSAIGTAEADEAVRVIMVTGAGRGFCAGADMSLLSGIIEEGGASVLQRDYSWLLQVGKPVIAAVNGHCVGLGFVIALYCDVRLAADTAKFSTIFAKRGLIAEYGLAWTLPRIAGVGKALDLLLTARMFDGNEAARLGLVEHVFPEAEFAMRAIAYSEDIAQNVSPRSTRVMKAQVYAALDQPLSGAVTFAHKEMVKSLQCEDFKEGVAHFLEKRQAKFTGR
jgi:enoyl-CoA hydratase/carnithine racemase